MALLVTKHKGTLTEDLLRHCGCAKWATSSTDCVTLRGKFGCILAPFGFRWSSSSRKRGEISSCMAVSCKWTVTSLVPTPWASTDVRISGWHAIRPRRSSRMARCGTKVPTCLDMAFRRGLAGVRRAQRRLCAEFQRQTVGFCAQFQAPLRSVTNAPLYKVATSHFGASVRRAGGSTSRPFWSRGARPGRPLWAPPMRGPFPLVMAHPPSWWMCGTSIDSRSQWHWYPVCCLTRAPRFSGPPPLTLRSQPKTCGAGSHQPASPRLWRTPSRWRPTQCHTWWERASTPPG